MIQDKKLLNNYIENFYGYGNLDSNYWFIGKEEAGGETHQEINSRLKIWKSLNEKKVIDTYDFHKNVVNENGKTFEFLFEKKVQNTWLGLIKTIFTLEDKTWTSSDIKNFRTDCLGREYSNNCLLEMFPLPSPKANQFNYIEWTDYKTRENYKTEIKDLRINNIKKLIKENQPKIVIFYSTDKEYCNYWTKISEIDFDKVETKFIKRRKKNSLIIKLAKKNNITYAIINHPTSIGVSDAYYKEIGEQIRTVANIG